MNATNELIGLENNQRSAPLRILLLQDDVELASAISDYLRKQGTSVFVESRRDQVLTQISQVHPDLVILDVMRTDKDGFDVCHEIRAGGFKVPIIILSAREEDFDQAAGIDVAADDYLAKPLQPRVLLARIKAIARQLSTSLTPAQGGDVLQFGRLRLDFLDREVKLGERRIELSPTEFDLLWLLASNAGRVMLRNDILKSLRGLHYSGADRSVDARLYHLRRRLGADNDASWNIKSVRPHGYLFCQETW